jgi:chromosome segregation ATPase
MSQMESLQSELAELIKERDEKEARLQTTSSTPEVNALQSNINALDEEITNKRAQMAAEETQDEINTAVYAALEDIRIAFVLTTETYTLEEKIDVIAKALSEAFEKSGEVAHSLRRELKGQESLINELRSERDAANVEVYDLQSKLKNAAEQLDEEKRSSKEKDEEINRLREALSKSETVPVKSYQDSKEEHQKALEGRPAIYDLEWTDTIKRTHYTAKKAETGEQMEPFSRLTLGLYRVLEGEELERFRAEYAAAEMDRLAQEAHNVVVPDLQFPGQEEGSTGGLAGYAIANEVVEKTNEERIEQLEREMSMMHDWVRGISEQIRYEEGAA